MSERFIISEAIVLITMAIGIIFGDLSLLYQYIYILIPKTE